ncbi:DUF916 and DUF3324 domain-containing protein [Enterococcus thailandicus]|nr:DUF916 and DUF3324 domain-containing protein [Enterococcus thailandicus]MDA3973107.1 DUF916 and DUF3324 domain-containing protein [Enterococcus thailandicus]MDA3975459.1 DUF916 and DUF3324 domain-containing protein [Enterococcus thailandicus]MDA3980567.1 DUF916 and DUF3324 domain-containing protein [Enterococcus thailandicus]
MKRKQLILTIALVILSVFSINVIVAASEFNFAVTPITPENQIDKEKTYFDIQLDPGEKEELKVVLRNDTDKDVTIEVSLNSATTNSNVVVEYGKNEIEKDSSLTLDLEEYVDYPKSITLKPHSNQTVAFQVTMPKEMFDGVLAGGITFKEVQAEDQQKEKDEQGLSIKNEYSYVVALLMRQNLNEVAPNLLLHEVKPGQINARNVILANIQNDQKTYINQVSIQTKITKKGQSEVLYHEEKENLQIAPNSNFSFPTSLGGAALEPGEYHLKMTIFGNENESGKFTRENANKTVNYSNYWEFEKDFTIAGDVAKKLNAQDVTIKKDNTKLYILIGIIFLLLMLLLILWLIWRKKKHEEEQT